MGKVKLRGKKIKGDCKTLFLDIYPPVPHPKTGKLIRKYYLKLYTYDKPKSSLERKHNSQTLELAEYLCAKCQIDIYNCCYSFLLKG